MAVLSGTSPFPGLVTDPLPCQSVSVNRRLLLKPVMPRMPSIAKGFAYGSAGLAPIGGDGHM